MLLIRPYYRDIYHVYRWHIGLSQYGRNIFTPHIEEDDAAMISDAVHIVPPTGFLNAISLRR